jgi:hypothetical protein
MRIDRVSHWQKMTLQEAVMAKYEHGKMDISEQEKTFNGFVRWSVWGASISIGVLIFLALANS